MNRQIPCRTATMVRASVSCFLVAIWAAGCGKSKHEEFPASSPSADGSASPPPNASAAAANPAPTVDSQKTFAEVETAIKSKDYEKAVDAAFTLGQQQKQFTEAQSQAAHHQMVRLQQEIAAAASSGDPRAKAAADKLRQMAGPK